MRFEQLKQFSALGEFSHFRLAAEKSAISTSALTRSIQTLEQELGHHLVIRSTRSVELTKEGEVFLSFCQHTLNEYDAMLEQLQRFEHHDNSKLIVGYCQRASDITPRACGMLMTHYPQIKVEMQLLNHQELSKNIRSGVIDIAILDAQSYVSDGAIALNEQVMLVGRSDHPLFAKELITPHDLVHYPLYGCLSNCCEIQGTFRDIASQWGKTDSLRLGCFNEIAASLEHSNNLALVELCYKEQVENNTKLSIFEHITQSKPKYTVLVKQCDRQPEHVQALHHLITSATN